MLAFPNCAALILTGVAASLFTAVSPATAQDNEVVVRGLPEGTNMRLVSYADLNLNRIAHRKVLDRRIGRAVEAVCEYKHKDVDAMEYRECADAAWAGARPQIVQAYVRAAQLAYNRR